MKEKTVLVRVRFRDRVTLEPALANIQRLEDEELLRTANQFFRFAKQIYKLYDIRRADALWDEKDG